MRIIRTRDELKVLDSLRQRGDLVFVPTMGALHSGHFSLVETALDLGPVVVSIFVNPTQFGPGEDFDRYPRDLQADLDLLAPLGVDAVFAPEAGQLYDADDQVTVAPGRFAEGLCGAGRPGHFAGVLTIVAKLFNLVRPEIAVFGRKDAQQFLAIAEMVRSLAFPVRLIDAPTVREADGLAMSSRNRYLSNEERKRALVLSSALSAAHGLLADGERDTDAVEVAMRSLLSSVDRLEYVEIHALPTYARPNRIQGRTLLAIAARVGATRLIDNLVLNVASASVNECSLLEDD